MKRRMMRIEDNPSITKTVKRLRRQYTSSIPSGEVKISKKTRKVKVIQAYGVPEKVLQFKTQKEIDIFVEKRRKEGFTIKINKD